MALISVSVPWQPTTSLLDPFNTLPVTMPLKSRELFHYFARPKSVTQEGTPNCLSPDISFTLQNPDAFRIVLLFAGMHYKWDTGRLLQFKETVTLHTTEGVRLVNNWLSSNDVRAWTDMRVRFVLTLCVTESIMPNIIAAKVHLNGITALMALRDELKDNTVTDFTPEDEMTERFVVLTYSFIGAVLGRLKGFPILNSRPLHHAAPANASVEENLVTMDLKWRYSDMVSLDMSLDIVRLMSQFSRPPTSRRPQPIDALPVIEVIRRQTAIIDMQTLHPGSPLPRVGIWGCGQMYLHEVVKSNVLSYTESPAENAARRSPWMTSWLGFVAACHLYYSCVLRTLSADQPARGRIVLRLLTLIDRDLRSTEAQVWASKELDCTVQDLWLWKAFLGLFVQDEAAEAGRESQAAGDKLVALRLSFRRCLRRWNRETEATGWRDAIEALRRVVWPVASLGPDAVEMVWDEVVGDDRIQVITLDS